MPLAAVVREEEVALENRGSELALVSRQATRKSDEGRCILHRDSEGCAGGREATKRNLQQCAFSLQAQKIKSGPCADIEATKDWSVE